MDVATNRQATPTASLSAGGAAAGTMLPEQHRLLMSRENMNLTSVRTRAQDLQKTIIQAIFDLETAPERYDWSNVLERFAVMNTQLHSISGQMVPLMEHYIVHPKGPTGGRQQTGYVQGMTDSINRLVDFLTVPQEGKLQSGMLDVNKGQLRREIAKTSCVPKSSAPGGQRMGAAQSRPVVKLEGPDLFLAVVSKGHGIRRSD